MIEFTYMITQKYTAQQFIDNLTRTDWTYIPSYADIGSWEKALTQHAEYAKHALSYAEESQVRPWPELRFSLYNEFQINGNRSHFEEAYFFRRNNLASWCIAECLERKGRFIETISDAMWSICEETSWCLPAHNTSFHQQGFSKNIPIVDLFAAETAMMLVTLYTCMKPALSENHAALSQRIEDEVSKRVLEPVESGTDYWWLAGKNNWTPWCASNCLIAAAQLWPDSKRFARFAYYLAAGIDRFIDTYGEDGACDEGPGYWGKAAGAMLIFTECLFQHSGGKISIYDSPKIKNMGMFIVHARLHDNRFINFADAHARMTPHCPLVYRFGERCQSPELMNFAREMDALAMARLRSLDVKRTTGAFLESSIFEFFWMDRSQPLGRSVPSRFTYLPDREIFIARESEQSSRGFIIAAKGGHNQENHNHNDVGQFILYHDGMPIIVDVGVGTYTRETFQTNERYKIWPLGAQSHNPPIVNGILQQDGEHYTASEVIAENNESSSSLRMHLENAYEYKAGCDVICRHICLQRQPVAEVIIEDLVQSAQSTQPIQSVEIRLVSPLLCVCQDNVLTFPGARVQLTFDAADMSCQIETKTLEDPVLIKQWGTSLSVLTFHWLPKQTRIEAALKLRFYVPE